MKPFILLLIGATSLCSPFGGEVEAAVRAPWTSSKISGTPYPAAPFRARALYPDLVFPSPSSIEEIPETQLLMITQMGGQVVSVPKAASNPKPNLVLDLAQAKGGSASVIDSEFHPDFLKNRYVFLCYNSAQNQGRTHVSRFQLPKSNPPKIDPSTEQVIITWPSGGHNGGCLEFGQDSYLYISTGDGSGPNPPDARTTGQDVSDLLGAVLRIDINRTEGDRAYRIPSDNPFVGQANARPEIWAYGFRNPWKIGVDRESPEVFAADNGWETWELVHRVTRGSNGGWPVREGRDLLRSEVPVGPTPIVAPFKDHHHTEANSVIGGPVYRGDRYPELDGWFVYGDYITGTIWAVKPKADLSADFQTLADTDYRMASFTEGSRGEIYFADYDSTQQLYELVRNEAAAADSQDPFPTQLRDTGLFQSLNPLTPMPGVVPYEVQVARWADGAVGQRWIAIPGQGIVSFPNADEPATFPEGTVLVKHLSLPRSSASDAVPLETQLLHLEQGTWRPYSYVWNDAGTEATLADPTGVNRTVSVPDRSDELIQRTWHVGAHNECRLCHNADAGYVLGFTPNQLQQQLQELAQSQVIESAPPVPAKLQLVNPHDTAQSLDDRARSYLHANCAMCHRPGGSVIASFFLRRDLPFDALRTNKGTGVGTFGMRNAKVIAAGDPYRSVVMYRMSKLGYSRMPYIGTQKVDSQAIALISEWIQSMAEPEGELASPPLKNGSPEAQAIALIRQPQVGTAQSREDALLHLAGTTEGALALARELHAGTLSKTDRADAIAAGNASSDTNIRGLFETFIPEHLRRKRLGNEIDPQSILSLTGDAPRGKALFEAGGVLCKSCHHPSDPAQSLGTPLTEIRRQYPQAAELLRHILSPSLTIKDAYANYTIEFTDGTSMNGLITQRTDDALTIKTPELETFQFPNSEIRSTQRSPVSPMPTGVLSDVTAQDAADLIAYILSVD